VTRPAPKSGPEIKAEAVVVSPQPSIVQLISPSALWPMVLFSLWQISSQASPAWGLWLCLKGASVAGGDLECCDCPARLFG
jgi:hypothetical protein